MTWTNEDFPVAFKSLSAADLATAIAAANTGVSAGKSENAAIKDALASLAKGEEAKELLPADRLLPHNNGWAVLSKNGKKVLSVYGFFHVAERKLKEFDKAGVS